MMSDASDMLAAALEQMDGIIAGSKALEYSNGIFDCQSPTSPFMGGLRALHLVEDLRGLLEMMEADEREGLRCQVPDSTAEALIEWLQSQMVRSGLVSPVTRSFCMVARPAQSAGLCVMQVLKSFRVGFREPKRGDFWFGGAAAGPWKSCCSNTLCSGLVCAFVVPPCLNLGSKTFSVTGVPSQSVWERHFYRNQMLKWKEKICFQCELFTKKHFWQPISYKDECYY
uniref:PPFIA binding protein 1 n=1 Tax=Strix occidentalis caurina TaxID=311401 RepID=A0A8D0KZC8_STROC